MKMREASAGHQMVGQQETGFKGWLSNDRRPKLHVASTYLCVKVSHEWLFHLPASILVSLRAHYLQIDKRSIVYKSCR